MVNIDTVSGQLILRGMTAASWVDEYLTWNQTENGIDRLTVYDEKIWEPHFDFSRPPSGTLSTVKQVFASGLVVLTILADFEMYCDLNMRYFPMDSHYCRTALMSSANAREHVTLTAEEDGIVNVLRPHGEWTVDKTVVTKGIFVEPFTNHGIDVLNFTLLLSRKYAFNLLHKGAPQCLLTFTNIFVHLIPVNSGERVSFAATIFLAFVFWQTIVIDDLPEHSAKISLFSVILTLCMTLSTLSLVVSIVLTKISFETDKPIPERLRRLAVFVKRTKRKQKHPVHGLENKRTFCKYARDIGEGHNGKTGNSQDFNENNTDVFERDLDSVIEKLKADAKGHEVNRNEKEIVAGTDDIPVTWLDVVDLIDVILFWALIVTIAIGIMVFVMLFIFQP